MSPHGGSGSSTNSAHGMARSSDKLAFALAAATPLSRAYYKRVFEHLYFSDAVPAGYQLDDVDYHRYQTELNLDALDVCDFEFGENPSIHNRPPYLGVLPRSGFPTAVLFGARLPAIISRLTTAVRARKRRAALAAVAQPAFVLLPHRIRVEAESVETLADIAAEAGIRFTDRPPAADVLAHVATVQQYEAALDWRVGAVDLDWRREDFDVALARFAAPRADAVRLSRFTHPQRAHRREHYLVIDDRRGEVDARWGRFVMLHKAGRSVLSYDANLNVLLLPRSTPLPRLFARALVACSGFAPQDVNTGRETASAFVQVPRVIAVLAAEKLGQQLVNVTLTDAPRGTHD